MKYTVDYTELLCKTIIVDANSEKEAKEKVLEAVANEAIILTADDYVMDSGEITYCCISDSCDLRRCPTLESFTD
jgi:hypothetical protein|nr:MAG TPA_asm: PcfM DpnD/PcfM-like protein [Caudoviricetes sp.]